MVIFVVTLELSSRLKGFNLICHSGTVLNTNKIYIQTIHISYKTQFSFIIATQTILCNTKEAGFKLFSVLTVFKIEWFEQQTFFRFFSKRYVKHNRAIYLTDPALHVFTCQNIELKFINVHYITYDSLRTYIYSRAIVCISQTLRISNHSSTYVVSVVSPSHLVLWKEKKNVTFSGFQCAGIRQWCATTSQQSL